MNTSNTLITCKYIEKNKRAEERVKSQEERVKRQEEMVNNLSRLKCSWCDQLGHYKSECKEMELFIMEEERVRHELRYAQKREYEKKFPDLLGNLKKELD